MSEEVVIDEMSQDDRLELLSQKVFGKSVKDIKYLLVTNYIHAQLLDEELARTGLYQWVNVFKGDIKYPRDVVDYSKYDIIQVNLTAQDIHLLADIKDSLPKDSKTRLVLNNDYTTESWGKSFPNPGTLARELNVADMVFGTEYYQVTALTELLNRRVYIIPHPADVKRLKSLSSIPKKNIISTIWRRYDNFSYIPHFVVRNHGLTTQLIGFDKNLDNKTYLTTTLYDYVFQGTNYFDFCNQMRESLIVYDPFTYHSYNRAIVDCAALGVAVVGSNRTQSVNVCYPYTKVDPYDVTGARKLIEKLIADKEFYDKVVNYAKDMVEVYNHKNSMEKYLTALDESLVEEIKKRDAIPVIRDKGIGEDVLTEMQREKNRNEK